MKNIKKIKIAYDEMKNNNVPASIVSEKPLNTRTENNYLRLIFALAGNIVGFNYNKPYESAKLIIDATEINISQQTIADYISKAHALDSKEKD